MDEIAELTKQIHELELKMAALPGQIGDLIDEKCITRREFKAVNTLMGIVMALIGGFVALKGVFTGS